MCTSRMTTLEESNIFEAAGALGEIGSSLNITNFNQVKLVQIHNTQCNFLLCALGDKFRW